MYENAATEEESIDLEQRDVRALTECMSVLEPFADASPSEYLIVSESGSEYHVDVLVGTCDCPDHEHRGAHCKHLRAAEFASGRREIPEWVDHSAIENTLGEHIDASPVFASEVEPAPDVTGEAPQRAVTDGGAVVSDSEPQGSDGQDGCPHGHPRCDGADADDERPELCPECWEEWAAYSEEETIVRAIEEVDL